MLFQACDNFKIDPSTIIRNYALKETATAWKSGRTDLRLEEHCRKSATHQKFSSKTAGAIVHAPHGCVISFLIFPRTCATR